MFEVFSNFAAVSTKYGMAVLVLPILYFFWWLEKKHPSKAKKTAIIFAAVIWGLVAGTLVLYYFTNNL